METESRAAGPSVRLAAGADVPALADVLAQAFDADPFFSWIAGDGPRRAERSRQGWAGILRYASAGLSATWTTDDLAGVALWIPPGRPFSSFWDNLRLTPSLARLTGWRRLPVTAFGDRRDGAPPCQAHAGTARVPFRARRSAGATGPGHRHGAGPTDAGEM